ncbi:MAG: DUF4852 domain-containing protein [Sulfurovum sp.]|nr:DUF4852 domain-containing protein [Sulfurovum sp.]
MKKILAIAALLLSVTLAEPLKINEGDYIERGSSDVIKRYSKFDQYSRRHILQYMYPNEFDKIVKEKDEFIVQDWYDKAVTEFKKEISTVPSFDMDATYQIDLLVDYGKYDFKRERFEILNESAIFVTAPDRRFSNKNVLISFKNIYRNFSLNKEFYLRFSREDARKFDKFVPRKLLLTYVFKVEKIENRTKPRYNATNGMGVVFISKVKYIDVKSASGKHVYKRIEVK